MQPGERVDQLGLAVAVDTGDAHDLAGADLEGHAPAGLEAAVVHDDQVLDDQERLSRLSVRLLDSEDDLAPDHHPREAFLRRPLRGDRVHLLPRGAAR